MTVVDFLEAGVIQVALPLTQGGSRDGHGTLVGKLECGAETSMVPRRDRPAGEMASSG